MFEQTFVSEPKTARKPYSMVLSLIIQIVVIAILSLMPFVFTQVLPSMQLKSVLAAPPKPPVALRAKTSVAPATTALRPSFRLPDLSVRARQPVANGRPVEAAPAGIDIGVGEPNGVPDGIISSAPAPLPPPLPAAKAKPQGQQAIRVGTISGANLIHMVQPAYPPLARASRIQGTVEFAATISKEGVIENLVLLRGHPLLINAAKEAVLQWRYRPTLLNGEPVEVITDIVVNFSLNQ